MAQVRGQFQALHTKINKFLQKQHFDVVFCVGQFFSASETNQLEELENLQFSIPIYFIIGNETISESLSPFFLTHSAGGKLRENVFFLGFSGFSLIQGFKVGFLSGTFNPTVASSKRSSEILFPFHYSLEDLKDLHSIDASQVPVDIFLSSEWPQGQAHPG